MRAAATSLLSALFLTVCVCTSCYARPLQQRALLQTLVTAPGVSVVQEGGGTQVTFPGGSVVQDGQGNTQTTAPGTDVYTAVESPSLESGGTGRKLQGSDTMVTFPGGSVVQQGDKVAVEFPGGSVQHFGDGKTQTSVPGYADVSTQGQAVGTQGQANSTSGATADANAGSSPATADVAVNVDASATLQKTGHK